MNLLNSFMLVLKSRARIIIFVYTLTSIFSFLIGSTESPSFINLIKLSLAVTASAYSIYLYNDLQDLEDDLKYINLGKSFAAKRPLASGMILKGEMKKFIIFFTLLSLITAYLINPYVFFSQLCFIVLGFAYSTDPIRLKKRFIFKQLTIAFGGLLTILSGGYAGGVISGKLIFLMIIGFLMYFTLPSLTDLRDLKWDREVRVKSFPVVLGPKFTVRLMLATVVSIIGGFIVGFYRLGFDIGLTVISIIILTSFIYVLYPLLIRWNDENYIVKVTNRLFLLWIILLIAIFFI